MANVSGVLAVDLGGTNLRAAAVSPEGRVLHRGSIPTNDELGPASVIERMSALCQRVADSAGLGADAPIGVASPGPLDPRTGVVLFTPNLEGWQDIPLADELGRLTGRRARLANDANCAGLGEARFGAGMAYDNIVYLGLGTGVGGGIIIDGEMYEGGHGLGVELGHVCVSMEAYASGWAIAREAELVADAEDGAAIRAAAAGREPDARAVTDAALMSDPAAVAILQRAGRALGAAIGVFINIFNPEAVIIGGGLAASGDAILGPARTTLPAYSFRGLRDQAVILPAKLGDDNGLIGAAAVAMDLQRR
jgi:glucokinase